MEERVQQNNVKSPKNNIGWVFVRQCFKYQDSIGYLLSNGVVGSLNKPTGVSLVFQFGQQYYWELRPKEKPLRRQVPEDCSEDRALLRLFHFKAFFIEKYSLFKMQEMRKRTGGGDGLLFLKKGIALNDLQIVTRLSNNIIQLHFSDLTSLALNRDEQKGIYLVTKRGELKEVNYNQCKNARLKCKVRRFSNLI